MVTSADQDRLVGGTEARLQALARDKLEAFAGTIRPNGTYKDAIYKGSRKTAAQIASDYGRRFLVELIQNAYDALPADAADGRVKIFLAPEDGEHGILYVCNSGKGFQWKNVEALCGMGLSSKPAGEAIGNKGFGFRSVSYISDDPYIYSAQGTGGTQDFDGFCFRFARNTDFTEMLEDNVHAALAAEDLPPFHVPIVVEATPDQVATFGEEGYVTVVALPIRDANAATVVREELDALRSSDVPLLLFLPKIERLEIRVANNESASFVRKRRAYRLLDTGTNGSRRSLTIVDLVQRGRFLVCMATIDRGAVLNAIEQSIHRNELHPDWQDWEGDGEIACAVRIDDGPVQSRLYTFLPMGEQAEAPMHGYLHGSFFPKADRTSLNASIPLNALHLREGIQLIAWAVKTLRSAQPESDVADALSWEQRGSAIIDLMCWHSVGSIEGDAIPDYVAAVRDAFEILDLDLTESDFLPALRAKSPKGWSALTELKRWTADGAEALSSTNLVNLADLAVVPASFGQERLDRLHAFANELDGDLSLDIGGDDLANAVAAIAAAWAQRDVTPAMWEKFYVEVFEHFEHRHLFLRDRQILLCQDDSLRNTRGAKSEKTELDDDAGRRQVRQQMSVFAPPRRLGRGLEDEGNLAELLQIPDVLSDSFAFLSDRLDWAGRLSVVVGMFERNNLIYAYDAGDVVSHLARLVRSDGRKSFRHAALHWVFKLYRASKRAGRPFSVANAGLYVPTLDGRWVRASNAFFSKSWPRESLGADLEQLFVKAAGVSPDLDAVRDQLLAGIDEFREPGSDQEWYSFLTEMGVNRGLQARKVEPRNFRISGKVLNVGEVCNRCKLGERTQAIWQAAVEVWGDDQVYWDSLHRIDGHIWYLPGQGDFDRLPPDAKSIYAALIVDWLANAPDNAARVNFYSDSFRIKSRFGWPTPIGAFLKLAEWVPSATRGEPGIDPSFTRPSNAWLPDMDQVDRLPGYLPGLVRIFNQALRRNWSAAERLVNWAGARVFNHNEHLLGQVTEMGRLFLREQVDRYYLRSFWNDYIEAWGNLANDENQFEWTDVESLCLVVRRSGDVAAVAVAFRPGEIDSGVAAEDGEDSPTQRIYMRDTKSRLESRLLESLGESVFDIGNERAVRNLRDKFEARLAADFVYVSDINIVTYLDGEPLSSDDVKQGSYLVDHCRWLPILLSLAMESLTSIAAQRLPADRSEVINRLSAIKLRLGQRIEFDIDGRRVLLPEDSHGSLDFRDRDQQALVVESSSQSLEWDTLVRASTSLCRMIGYVDLDAPLKLVLRKLEQLGEDVPGPQSAGTRLPELASELGLSSAHLDIVARIAAGNLEFLLQRLRPVVHYYGGNSALTKFDVESEELEHIAALSPLLEELLGLGKEAIFKIVDCCRQVLGLSELRDWLQLEFARFNETLIAVGERPITYPAAHLADLRQFIEIHQDTIMDAVRLPHIVEFDSGRALDNYVARRDELQQLEPDASWLSVVESPDEQLLHSHVNSWLARGDSPAIGVRESALPPWTELRRDNSSRIRTFVKSHAIAIRAWRSKHDDQTASEMWDPPEDLAGRLTSTFDSGGLIDFRILDEAAIVRCLISCDLWPSKMPQDLSLPALGLSDDDLCEEQTRETQAREERARQARSVEFNGRVIDSLVPDYDAIDQEIDAKFGRRLAETKLSLSEGISAPERRRGTGKGGGAGRGAAGAATQSPEKDRLVGFLGECQVYHWLKRVFPKRDIDKAWKSGYRSTLLPGEGDDNLGYDFSLSYQGKEWFLEVKASQGDPRRFELGESEVRFGGQCVGKTGKKYCVVYVSNVTDSQRVDIEVLPNPLSPEGKAALDNVGKGLRYRFDRAS